MRAQVMSSILIGLAISAVLFLPLVIWQYRRYGRFDAGRMAWTFVSFIYLSALIAFTIFPIPDFTTGFCPGGSTEPVLDPLRVPRDMLAIARESGLRALAKDWVVWEVALNVLLFVPFGFIVHRVLEWPRWTVLLAALAVSGLIEATQLTGNWGLSPCAYRVADVTDLISNTTGAAVGLILERITPRLLSRKAHLVARRSAARPVTRGRRLLGMLLDAAFIVTALWIGRVVSSIAFWGFTSLSTGDYSTDYTAEQYLALERTVLTGGAVAVGVLVLLPALVGTGASLGQRAVYLEPLPRRGGRLALLARALIVQGVGAVTFTLGTPWMTLGVAWGLVSALSVLIDPRGISARVTGCTFVDSRADQDERSDEDSRSGPASVTPG